MESTKRKIPRVSQTNKIDRKVTRGHVFLTVGLLSSKDHGTCDEIKINNRISLKGPTTHL